MRVHTCIHTHSHARAHTHTYLHVAVNNAVAVKEGEADQNVAHDDREGRLGGRATGLDQPVQAAQLPLHGCEWVCQDDREGAWLGLRGPRSEAAQLDG